MSCKKYQIINTGATNVYITFRKCEDGAYEYNKEIIPFRIYNLWTLDGIVSSAERAQIAFEDEGEFPPPPTTTTTTIVPASPTPTPTPTPTVTDTPTPTPTVTPTISVTPTITPTNTPTTSPPAPLQIGQNYAGGKIAYIDGTGQHGFVVNMCYICSIVNQGLWGQTGQTLGLTGTTIGYGGPNTDAIMANNIGVGGLYAYYATNDTTNGYTDWKIPSLDEMVEIYNANQYLIAHGSYAQFGGGLKWTSTEIDGDTGYLVNLDTGVSSSDYKNVFHYSNAIRYF